MQRTRITAALIVELQLRWNFHNKNCEVSAPALAILIYTPLFGLAEVAEVKIKIPGKSLGWMLPYTDSKQVISYQQSLIKPVARRTYSRFLFCTCSDRDSYRTPTGVLQDSYRTPTGLLQDSYTTPTGLL